MFTGMFRNDTFETCIKNAASIGFDAVEIRFAPPHFNVQDNNKTLKEKSDIIQNYGLEVAEIYTFIGGFSTKTNQECEQEVESFRYQAEAAKLLGANMIKISPGGPNAFLAKPEHFERSARWISKLANIAKAYNLRITLEIHNESLVEDITHALQLLQMIQEDSVGLIHDAGNMYITGEDYGEDSVKRLGSHLFHVHIKDVLRTDDTKALDFFYNTTFRGKEGFRLTALNEGGVDHLPMLRALKKNNYQGYLSLEANLTMDSMVMAKHEFAELQKMLHEL